MPVDVLEIGDDLVVKAVIPGVSKEKLHIHYEQNVLTLKAEFEDEPALPDGVRWLLRERSLTSVSRTFRLLYPINADKAQAEFQDGVLRLTLPKLESAKPRQIAMQ